MENLTRRGFLSGAAVATIGGLATSGLGLVGCTPSAAPAQSSTEERAAGGGSRTILNPQDDSYDTYTTDYAAIFEPIQIGNLTLRNRIIKSAAGDDTGDKNLKSVTQNTLDYYGKIADGGASLIILPSTLVAHLGFDPRNAGKYAFENPDDGIAAGKVLTDRIHEAGCYIGFLLNGPGTLKESAVDDMTTEAIRGFVKETAECARRLRAAGFDMVEVKASATDGLNAFVSRRSNKREDEYGPQSLENRTRLFVEMIQACKQGAGDDFVVCAHINGIEESDQNLGENDKFITIDEAKEVAKIVEAAGADMIQVRAGTPGKEIHCWGPDGAHAGYHIDGATGFGTQFDYATHFGGMIDGSHSGVGAYIPLVEEIKKVVSVPVGCAGYMDPRTAPDLINGAVADGRVDLVFMNRPLTIDPELPNKLAAGKREEVAPCCRCLHCHDQTMGIPECCRVNATLHHAFTDVMPEGYDLPPTDSTKNVLVVGGGPAGMEAARIAALRGHTVTLCEKSGSLGGLMASAEAYKGKHERIGDLVAYLSHQLELTGVKVVLNQEVDVEYVNSQNPDAVIVATGGKRESRLEGQSESPAVIGFSDIAGGNIGDNVVILGAGAQAIDVAVYLLDQGKRLTIVHEGTRKEVDKEQSAWYQQIIPPHLMAHGVKIWNEATVDGVSNGNLSITTSSGTIVEIPCDTVIECYDMVENTELFDSLSADFEKYAVGDCAKPWNIQQAIFTGNITARAL